MALTEAEELELLELKGKGSSSSVLNNIRKKQQKTPVDTTEKITEPIQKKSLIDKLLQYYVNPLAASAVKGYASGATLGLSDKFVTPLLPKGAQGYIKGSSKEFPEINKIADLLSYIGPGAPKLISKIATKAPGMMVRGVSALDKAGKFDKIYNIVKGILPSKINYVEDIARQAGAGAATEGIRAKVENNPMNPKNIPVSEAIKRGAVSYAIPQAISPVLARAGKAIMGSYMLKGQQKLAEKSAVEKINSGLNYPEQVLEGKYTKGLSAEAISKNIGSRTKDIDKEIDNMVESTMQREKIKMQHKPDYISRYTVNPNKVITIMREDIAKSHYGTNANKTTQWSGSEMDALKHLRDIEEEMTRRTHWKGTLDLKNALNLKRQMYKRSQDVFEKVSAGATIGPEELLKKKVEAGFALGLKKEIEKIIPDIKPLNEEWSKLIGIQQAMDLTELRIGRNNVVSPQGLLTALTAMAGFGGGGAMAGGAKGAVAGTALGIGSYLAHKASTNPYGARSLYGLSKNPQLMGHGIYKTYKYFNADDPEAFSNLVESINEKLEKK
jgi:hypothetical protein